MAFQWFKKKKDDDSKPTGAPSKTPAEQAGGKEDAGEPMHPAPAPQADESAPGGLFARLRKGLEKTRKVLTTDIDELFAGRKQIDSDMLEDLEELLITSDIGVQTAMDLIENISRQGSEIQTPGQLKAALKEMLVEKMAAASAGNRIDDPTAASRPKPHVIMVVGVNGVGKTTTIGKLAAKYRANGKTVLIAAADTFRAAAIEQLSIWAERAGADIVKHKEKTDPSAVVYDSAHAALARGVDVLIIDTAGRLHTRVNLMAELEKIQRTASKIVPDAPHEILLVLDATTGQNAVSQADLFNQSLGVTGLVLTKLDGTAKGGIVISICSKHQVPLQYIGVGETIDDLQTFNPQQFVAALF